MTHSPILHIKLSGGKPPPDSATNHRTHRQEGRTSIFLKCGDGGNADPGAPYRNFS